MYKKLSRLLSDNPIFVTTYRADTLPTIENLPKAWMPNVTVVISEREEALKVANKYPNVSSYLYCPPTGIPGVRQFLLNYAQKENIPCLIMLDDDLSFKTATWEDGKKRFRKSTVEQLEESFFALITKALQGRTAFTAHGSAFFNETKHEWEMCKGNTYSFFVNCQIAKLSNASFDNGIPTMEDVQFSLMSYQAGFPSYSHMYHAVVDVGKKGKSGESAHDTPRAIRHERATDILVKQFPGIVRERVNKSKAHMENIGTHRDVTVAWKKALKP